MKVLKAFPPNYPELSKFFPVKGKQGILYAWGDRLYNPSGIRVTPWLLAHEMVHGDRQLASSAHTDQGIETWWDHYIHLPYFRIHEEILAHQAEWVEYKRHNPGAGPRAKYLATISYRLSSPLYGKLLTQEEAYTIIQKLKP